MDKYTETKKIISEIDEKSEKLAKAKLSRALNRIHVSEMNHGKKGPF